MPVPPLAGAGEQIPLPQGTAKRLKKQKKFNEKTNKIRSRRPAKTRVSSGRCPRGYRNWQGQAPRKGRQAVSESRGFFRWEGQPSEYNVIWEEEWESEGWAGHFVPVWAAFG